ncbi:FecR family protein [Parapedobacter sp. ISTM3]|uniref:FecR family protein n=1 Tax=Parapedobacter sp. ISTM3 TaxID=2800130 RepID=UPI001904E373|nr:FecR family protein [Parapedobacter sp. ISTM3]MBK1440630.1 FecR family protein [Parapedobacter sp. ISTM3]
MMDRAHLRYLLQRYLADEISADELRELKQYVQHERMDDALSDVVDELWQRMDDEPIAPASSDAMYQGILRHVNEAPDAPLAQPMAAKPFKRSLYWGWLAGAAALLCAGILLFRDGRWPGREAKKDQAAVVDIEQPIVPGGNKAVLTLADGREIDLSSDHSGIVMGDRITYGDGSVVVDGGQGHSGENEVREPMLITAPRGGTYQITLSDGTNVWLNSASTLKYPGSFTGSERIVELEGEAYFEVRGQKKIPFVVKTKNQTVEVLGTQFNIAAYPDESDVKTTLVEGSVQIRNLAANHLDVLKPGDQSVVRGAATKIRSVDVEQYIAWKNGYFAFSDDEHISQVMNVIARWYDIEVEYQGDMANKYFGGTISRFEDFETLLKTIALTGSIRFKITGRRVIVMT